MNTLNRRNFLRGVGVSLALPSLESLHAATAPKSSARRFVCVSPNYGMNPGGFFPEQTGSDYAMPTLLKPLERHKRDLTVFSNLDHPEVGGGHRMLEHLAQRGGAQGPKENPQRLLSLDQLLAEKIGRDTRFPSLRMGSGGISWSRAGVRLPTMGNPKEIFAELFLEDNPKLKAKRKQYLSEDASILDAVLEDTGASA